MHMNLEPPFNAESKLAEYEGLKKEIESILSSADADLTSQKGISKDPAVIKEQQEALKVREKICVCLCVCVCVRALAHCASSCPSNCMKHMQLFCINFGIGIIAFSLPSHPFFPQGFVTDRMEPLQKLMAAFAKCGQDLVGSAAPGVDTANLEKEMDATNERWTTLQQKVGWGR